MPIARVVIVGAGTVADPYRIPLPNYSDLSWDYVEMTAIVGVPTRDMPAPLPVNGSDYRPLIGDTYVLIGMSPEMMTAWYALLDSRYPDADPPHRPELA